MMTPLLAAKDNSMLEYLLKKLCCYRGEEAAFEKARHLVTVEAIDNQNPQTGDTPLISAIKSGFIYIAGLLYHCGADIRIQNNENKTASDYYQALIQTEDNQIGTGVKQRASAQEDFPTPIIVSVSGAIEEITID